MCARRRRGRAGAAGQPDREVDRHSVARAAGAGAGAVQHDHQRSGDRRAQHPRRLGEERPPVPGGARRGAGRIRDGHIPTTGSRVVRQARPAGRPGPRPCPGHPARPGPARSRPARPARVRRHRPAPRPGRPSPRGPAPRSRPCRPASGPPQPSGRTTSGCPARPGPASAGRYAACPTARASPAAERTPSRTRARCSPRATPATPAARPRCAASGAGSAAPCARTRRAPRTPGTERRLLPVTATACPRRPPRPAHPLDQPLLRLVEHQGQHLGRSAMPQLHHQRLQLRPRHLPVQNRQIDRQREAARRFKGARWCLLKNPADLDHGQAAVLRKLHTPRRGRLARLHPQGGLPGDLLR